MSIVHAANAAAFAPHWNINATQASRRLRKLHRIDTQGGDVEVVAQAVQSYPFERLVFAEGDSWFDKFTPLFQGNTNLLDQIAVPYFTGVVDVAHIGDVASDMVKGWQKRQTQTLFKLFDFDAILLSAGGNDLKNLFADLYQAQASGEAATLSPAHFVGLLNAQLASPQADDFFDEVIENIQAFVALRDQAGRPHTRNAPILVNGYDYIQPRPVKGALLGGMLKVAGPWLYPAMKQAGLSDGQMFAAARAVVDRLNERLQQDVASLPGVTVIDSRQLLTPALPGSSGPSGDWLDEIHPSAEGFAKLACHRWNVTLAQRLGWTAQTGDLVPALDYDLH